MTQHLPVVIADDRHDALQGMKMELEMKGWSVEVFSDLDAAARELVHRTDPYVLVLDYDFDRADGRTGLDLAHLLRTAHPYGPALPICCYSGRWDPNEFLEELRKNSLGAPTSFTQKDSDVTVGDMVAQAEVTFNDFRVTFEKQALRRALADENLHPGNAKNLEITHDVTVPVRGLQ